jgi:hypothetical protein
MGNKGKDSWRGVWGKPRTQARKAAMRGRTIALDPVHVLVTKVMAYAESTRACFDAGPDTSTGKSGIGLNASG